MRDPGWAAAWRYAIPVPAVLQRRIRWLHPPSPLHEMRGAVLGCAVFSPLIGVTLAFVIVQHGRVRLGEAGSGLVIVNALLGIAFVVSSIQASRARRRADDPDGSVDALRARLMPRVAFGAGVTLILEATAMLTGWWALALVGALPLLLAVLLVAPTRSRVAEYGNG